MYVTAGKVVLDVPHFDERSLCCTKCGDFIHAHLVNEALGVLMPCRDGADLSNVIAVTHKIARKWGY